MKKQIINRIFIIVAFNVNKISQILFTLSIILTAFCAIYYGTISLKIGYFFWFSFGFWGFSITIKNATSFLKKKYDENNEFYQSLLDRQDKKLSR